MIRRKHANKYLVIGNPIQHSLSPWLHREFARQFDIELQYDAYQVNTNDYQQLLTEFYEAGVLGINITAPLKEKLLPLVDHCSEQVTISGALNTLTFGSDGLLYAANTDGIGFIRDLTQRHNIDLFDKKVLLLGAGGALRGILGSIIQAQPESISIASRDPLKVLHIIAAQLNQFQGNICKLAAIDYTQLNQQIFDIIINTTSCGQQKILPPIPERMCWENAIFYDLNYGAASTFFADWLRQKGCQIIIDGIGMLLEQAAESFYIWHQKYPNTNLIYNDLRYSL